MTADQVSNIVSKNLDSVLRECVSMETAFQELATDYLFVKFCFIHTKEIGDFHDQADAKSIVIRGLLRGHNDMPCGWPIPGGWLPIRRIYCFQLLLISNIIFKIVRLIVE
jgi:hypothetical protein